MSLPSADQLIALLDLRPLPREGGYYRETYRSSLTLPASALNPPGSRPRYAGDKAAGTAIYYLLTPDTCSALHRLPTDEVYHFYLGDPVELLLLDPETGTTRVLTLGPDVLAGQQVQAVVPAGWWQGSLLAPGGRVALMGTTMAPGFDFSDYEPGRMHQLQAAFPDFAERIGKLCPEEEGS